jgi:hypothetical protein
MAIEVKPPQPRNSISLPRRTKRNGTQVHRQTHHLQMAVGPVKGLADGANREFGFDPELCICHGLWFRPPRQQLAGNCR